jgi:hypothetical protein
MIFKSDYTCIFLVKFIINASYKHMFRCKELLLFHNQIIVSLKRQYKGIYMYVYILISSLVAYRVRVNLYCSSIIIIIIIM